MDEPSTTEPGPVTKPPRRLRLVVSLRAVLAIVLVVGLALGWKISQVREQERVVKAIRDAGGFVHYDWEIVNGNPATGQKPHGPKWLRRLIGDEFFQEVAWVSYVYGSDENGNRVENQQGGVVPLDDAVKLGTVKTLLLRGEQATDESLKKLAGMSNLEGLYIWDGNLVTDAGVAHMSTLKNLKKIHLSNSAITDESLGTLAKLPKLENISMQGSAFSDAGLAKLARHPVLKELYLGLGKTNITDAGLAHLRGIKTLEVIDLQRTNITDGGLKILAEFPKLKSVWLSEAKNVTPAAKALLRQKLANASVVD